MTIDQLKYLLTINQCRSITQAAQQLQISHQALSASIKSLEKELAAPLLEKTARGTTLTMKGKQLVEISTDFIHALDDIFAPRTAQPETFSLRIAASYVSITNYLASRLSDRSALPYILEPLFLEYIDNADIIASVKSHLADIGFCAFFCPTAASPDFGQLLPDQTLEHRLIASLQILCEMSPAHPLAYLEQIPLSKLHKYELRYFYPRMLLHENGKAAERLARNSAFHFTSFLQQFHFALETNPTLYSHALQNASCLGITIAETADAPYGLPRIPLQADCHFEIVAIRPHKDHYTTAEELLFHS